MQKKKEQKQNNSISICETHHHKDRPC